MTLPRTERTDFTATRCGYDEIGRTRRVKQALGTIGRTEFGTLGRPIEQWMGAVSPLPLDNPDACSVEVR